MIRYRPFLNCDPPLLAEVWRMHPPSRGRVQSITPATIESCLLSKPYFDRHGLILALEPHQPVGFVHAGFGPSDDLCHVANERGVICMLLAAPHPQRDQLQRELLARGEDYLRSQGAVEIDAFAVAPAAPFYLGLYGGSELPGVLASDKESVDFLRSRGYGELNRRTIFQLRLANFRPPIDRRLRQVGRRCLLETQDDPPAKTWWEAAAWGQIARTRFALADREKKTESARVTIWDMEPLASNWGAHAAGLIDVQIARDQRRQGLATYLLGETLRNVQSLGITLVEAQVERKNAAAVGLFEKLGFEAIDEGIGLRKSCS